MPYQIFTGLCLLLDNVFFPGWRKVNVDKSIFITGLFRSGTTFLFRHLAMDRKNFSAIRTWEMYVAPSIIQRKLFRLARKIDRFLGSGLIRIVKNVNSHMTRTGQFHKIGIWEEEEDEGLFLHIWDAFFTWFFFPDYRGITECTFPDRTRNPRRHYKRMVFYKNCIKRHMYDHSESAFYLSKNPSLSPRLDFLKQVFPDARIIYLVRDPVSVLPSQMGWFSFCWHFFSSPVEPWPFRDEVLEMTRHWYIRPLELFDQWDSGDYRIVEFKTLIGKPVDVIEHLYSYIGLPVSPTVLSGISNRNAGPGKFNNSQKLTLESIGWNEEDVRKLFEPVYQRFGFNDSNSE